MTKALNKPPFRADHVGSLLRPEALTTARRQCRNGQISKARLRTIEDDCVRDAVALQEGVGLKGITDGDMRRRDWILDFVFSLEGFEPSEESLTVRFSGGDEFKNPIPKITRKIACPKGGIMVEDFGFLKSVTKETAKIAIPAPSMLYNTVSREIVEQTAYDDWAEFWRDVGNAYAQAVGHFADAGCSYLQIDDVNAAKTGDTRAQETWKRQGFSVAEMVDRFIAANNAAIAARPAGMTAAVHMCRGNFQSQYTAEGGYDLMAERYFNEVQADAFFMEYDDPRSGGFEPLRFMPKDKIVVLGLVTTKRPELEDKDLLKRRIEEASKFVDLDRLCLSPQCGFASTSEGNKLTQDEQRRKLEHLVEVATEVWGGVM